MAVITGTEIFRTQDQILADLIASLKAKIPDAWTEPDGAWYIILAIVSGELEGISLSMQQALEDMFIQTAGLVSLRRLGDQYGLALEPGINSVGNLLFSGVGGKAIPIGAEASTDASLGNPSYFITTAPATIPNPGIPTAPVATISATAGALNNLKEYAVSFVTAGGETMLGADSNTVNPSNKQVDLTAIPIGGPGTTARKIYRSDNGAPYRFLATIADNTTTTYTDNTASVSSNALAPTVSTAERVSVAAKSEEPGLDKNVPMGTITTPTSVPDGITAVTNPAAFTGGTDEEDLDSYRQKLLTHVRNPQDGSPADLEEWAEEDASVDVATAFPNVNLAGAATPGTTTVRIAGPDGTVPDAATVTRVQNDLQARDVANLTIVVGTFAQLSTDVTVTLTMATGFAVADVRSAVQTAIASYINSVAVGGLLSVSKIHEAALTVGGVESLVVNSPTTDQTTPATSKRVSGVITVN